jgi:hypothetical protein
MHLAVGIAAGVVLAGALTTYLFDDDASLLVRLTTGAPIGLAGFGLLTFVLALGLGLTAATAVATAVVAISIATLWAGQRNRVTADVRAAWKSIIPCARPSPRTLVQLSCYSGVIVLTSIVILRVMLESTDGIATGFDNNLGDLPFHLSIVSGFAYGQNIPPQNPIYTGTKLTYPFLADFIAAQFVDAGATVRQALMLENMLLALSLLVLLYRWGLELTRDRLAAIFTSLLIVLNGGLGWILLIPTMLHSDRGVLAALASLNRDFTIGGSLRWGNSVTTLLIPQRAFLLGLPLAIVVFTLWWKAIGEPASTITTTTADEDTGTLDGEGGRGQVPLMRLPTTRLMIAAGAIAGLLPLAHAHTFAVVMGMSACLAVLIGPWRRWLWFGAAATVLAVPQIAWLAHGSSMAGSAFLAWHVGWDHGNQNVVSFWFANTGFVLPLIAVAYVAAIRDARLARLLQFYAPFLLCFFIPNLVRLSPWIWDNIKILFYWYVASAPILAMVLAWLCRAGRLRLLAYGLLISLTLAGALDLWRVISHSSERRIYSADGVAFAARLRQLTPSRALVLHAATYDDPVYLTGRRSLIGYPGHLWSHGIDYHPREEDVKRMYAGTGDAGTLLRRYGIDYAVIGPSERALLSVNEAFFARFPTIASVGPYRLYRLGTGNSDQAQFR